MLCETYQEREKLLLNLPLWTASIYTVPVAVARVSTVDLRPWHTAIRTVAEALSVSQILEKQHSLQHSAVPGLLGVQLQYFSASPSGSLVLSDRTGKWSVSFSPQKETAILKLIKHISCNHIFRNSKSIFLSCKEVLVLKTLHFCFLIVTKISASKSQLENAQYERFCSQSMWLTEHQNITSRVSVTIKRIRNLFFFFK